MNDQEIKNIISFLLSLAGASEKVIANGKLSLFDLPSFIGSFEAAGPAISDLKDLPAEIKALSPAVLDDLSNYIQANIGSSASPAIEALIQEGLGLGSQLYSFIQSIQAVKNPNLVAPVAAAPVPPVAPAP